jgi:hypothetical protein
MNIAAIEFVRQPDTLVRLLKIIPVTIQLRPTQVMDQSNDDNQVVVTVVSCLDNESFDNVKILLLTSNEKENTFDDHISSNGAIKLSLKNNYRIKLQFKFTSSTIYLPHRDLKIVVQPTEPGKTFVSRIESQSFCVVEKYLHVVTNIPEPYVYFKDIGGKDSGIPMTVTLRQSSTSSENMDPIITDRSIAIRPVLKYARGQSVVNQQILKSMHDPRKFVISKDGSTSLCFRISEVSSKHRNENFVVWMEQHLTPNSTEPVVDDIAPEQFSAFGYSVQTKSQR